VARQFGDLKAFESIHVDICVTRTHAHVTVGKYSAAKERVFGLDGYGTQRLHPDSFQTVSKDAAGVGSYRELPHGLGWNVVVTVV